MKFTGQIAVPARREAVYEKLCDARFFASCVEGVQDLNEIDPTHYEAILATKVAYIKFRFKIAVEITDLQPPARVTAKVEGAPMGIVGRLTARSTADLAVRGNETIVNYQIDAVLTGKLGSLGQPVMRSKAKEMERQFAVRLQAAFQTVA